MVSFLLLLSLLFFFFFFSSHFPLLVFFQHPKKHEKYIHHTRTILFAAEFLPARVAVNTTFLRIESSQELFLGQGDPLYCFALGEL